ncbi:MAG: DNA-binding protein [Phycisphaerae bacterium]|nr:DNA-binding protein [Phycisphaerae bacterium]
MAVFTEARHARYIIGKCRKGADLLEEITSLCAAEGVKLGRVEALGAVQKARLAFYDQAARQYRSLELDEPLEITSLVGNVSLKDGHPIVHAHVTLADAEGRAHGGHLVPGTIVFACEFCIQAMEGAELTRGLDEQTHLPLWKMD